MKKKILLCLFTAILLCSCKSNNSDVKQPVNSETSSNSSYSNDLENTDFTPPVLNEITVPEPNNLGKSGYLEIEMFDGRKRVDVYREVLESKQLTPYLQNGNEVFTETGHRIYVDSEGQKCVVSGVDVIPANGFIPDTRMSVKLRKEGTAERVRVFTDEAAYQTAVENYKVGQDILQGKVECPENCVILNGVYLPDVHFEKEDNGSINISLRQLAEADDENSGFFDFEGWVSVAVDLRNVDIPTDVSIDEVKHYFDVEEDEYTDEGGTWVYKDTGAAMWSDTFVLPKTDQAIMPIEDIARIFGWHFYVGDGIVSVVTNELDNNNNFVYQHVEITEESFSLESNDDA